MLAVKKLMPESLPGNMTPAPQWRLEWQRKKMERMQAKKETSESQTSLCRPSTKGLAKASGVLARVRAGMRKVTKAAKAEERTRGERQWQERRQRAGERWQRRNEDMLDVRQDRTHCSLVQERKQQEFVRNR